MAESLSASVDDAVELGVHGLGVGLVVDRVQHRLDPPPARLRGHAHEVGGVAGATPMPAGAGNRGADRVDPSGLRVGGDQLDPGQAAGGQRADEGQPTGAVLSVGDLHTEDLAVSVGVDPGGDQGVHVDHPARTQRARRARVPSR
jgi:hypothetical protein